VVRRILPKGERREGSRTGRHLRLFAEEGRKGGIKLTYPLARRLMKEKGGNAFKRDPFRRKERNTFLGDA